MEQSASCLMAPEEQAAPRNTQRITEPQHGRGWKGPLWAI